MKTIILMMAVILQMNHSDSFAGSRSWLDKRILFPSKEPIAAHSATRLSLPSGLEIWIHSGAHQPKTNQSKKAYFLHFIGNASRAEIDIPAGLGSAPRDLDIDVWSVNYPGYGGSAGEATLKALPGAALEAYDALAKQAAGAPIFVSGFSIGTASALYVATQREVRGLLLHNPPPIQKMIMGEFGWWNLWILAKIASSQVPIELDSYKNAPQVRAPAFFLSSKKDEIVPIQYQYKIIQRYVGEKKIVLLPDAGHNSPVPRDSYTEVREALHWLLNR